MGSMSVRSLCTNLLAIAATASVVSSTIIPGRFLVEFQDNANHDHFSSHLKRDGIQATPILKTESELFRAASYKFEAGALGEDPLSELAKIPSVKNVWPIEEIQKPKDKVIWQGNGNGNLPAEVEARVANAKAGGFAPHVMTQVDMLHAENITGKGIKVGIIDGGIDYLHPALGGGFGPGYLVARGYDFVGDDYQSGNDEKPDDDPYETCDGHGTHVAGIIAAQENELGFIGATPGVELGAYRVFSCAGGTRTDIIAAGVNRAFEDGNNIITASFSEESGWSETLMAVLADRLSEKGVIFTFANGNDGTHGPFNVGQPATSHEGLGVGSTETDEVPRVFVDATYSIANGTSKTFGWRPGKPSNWGNVTMPLVIADKIVCGDETGVGNLTGSVVLVKSTPNCADWGVVRTATLTGSKHVLIYNPDGKDANFLDATPRPDDPELLGVGTIPVDVAEQLYAAAAIGNVTIKITDPNYTKEYVDAVPNDVGGTMSTFSNWGPTFELDIKPDISAPGGTILSVYPEEKGKYAVISGTSMSTPLVASIIALIMEARGKPSVAEIRNLLSSTAKPIQWSKNGAKEPVLAPIIQQGGGLVQAYNAARSSTLVSVSKFNLNDTANFDGSREFTIKNVGEKDITYTISHEGAVAFNTFNDGRNPSEAAELNTFVANASVSLSSTDITISAGSEAKISVEFDPPAGLDAEQLPVYSGFIKISGTNGDALSIPYMGVATDMRSVPIFETTYSATSNSESIPIEPGYEFVMSESEEDWDKFHYPNWFGPLSFGTAYLDVQIWSVDVGNGTAEGSNETTPGRNLGSLQGFPWEYKQRGIAIWGSFTGTTGDGTRVPEGNYTIITRGLKIFGDREVEDDWVVVKSPPFGLKYV
ncbi:subtilisin-like protein [Aaosphaeria arxii CBS 175.79]|uniref:Subtilisin-like protein n=1 Tax=Aaosphaeria arxii CBS 175.79 TaxID=1450172 RepID=A0A6A5XEI5_9PLEO|nr:subtilisin-like protein [Aaosphaeria arxii CBS 175.79]KAF2011207.1 subtilisin-like protein [Aaosphaeria arxii CBS 175.79]